MAELKPCPFCCIDDEITRHIFTEKNDYSGWKEYFIHCGICGAQGPRANTRKQAIDAWNKRS